MSNLTVTRRALLFSVAAGLVWAVPQCGAAESSKPGPLVGLEVTSGSNVYRFDVEIADDADERAHGLMFRESMPLSQGMLFIYPSDQYASFWMKNTLIPLDMLFIDRGGVIREIAENAEPLSLQPVRSRDRVRAVLEINGGLAKRLGLSPGDKVRLVPTGNAEK